jgi:membrane protein
MAIPGWSLLRQALLGWWNDNALSRGAAIAYFTIFSLAPVLFIAIALAGLFFGREAAEGAIVGQLSGLMGHHTADALQAMIAGAYRRRANWVATGVGLVTLLLTATSAFGEIQSALNDVWRVKPAAATVFQLARARLISLGLT